MAIFAKILMFGRVLNTPLKSMFNFFFTFRSVLKFTVIQYYGRAPTVESFFIKVIDMGF